MRISEIERNTAETRIRLSINLDGIGKSEIDTGIGFLDHMLTLFASHSRFDLKVKCAGDTQVDAHHSTEDIGICLGLAIGEALGDKSGIRRYGDIILPMDETLMLCAADISGRSYCCYDCSIEAKTVGSFDTELAEEFWVSLSRSAGITLHFKQLAGKNTHHILESQFKAAGRVLRQAVSIDPELKGAVPSSKGVL